MYHLTLSIKQPHSDIKEFYIRLVRISLIHEIVRYSPAALCTLSIVWMTVFVYGAQAHVPNSSVGRVCQTKGIRLSRMPFVSLAGGAAFNGLLSKPSGLLVLFCNLLICGCQDNCVWLAPDQDVSSWGIPQIRSVPMIGSKRRADRTIELNMTMIKITNYNTFLFTNLL